MAWKSGVLVVRTTTTTVLQLYVLTYVCAVVDDVLIILNAHNRIYFWQH